ncbi:MAG: 50S ribosomal protein L13 [Deltaproteobacteria bacterium]|jgi:large subunit ribosomal protein L13|nr:50S ribosomal protein L13 [Deltaproteobacteria bacterium]MBW2532303.1 50S ribosomal protein L13 [Deltaproteobacteria bacterium]
MNPHRKSYVAKPADTYSKRGWWVIDAEGIPLGRLASVIATKVRGKDKPTFTPHIDTGDFVVVVNAAKTKLTGRKLQQKKYYRHSAYPGGLKQITYDRLMETKPEFAVLKAVRGMLPKNRLGRTLIKKVKVYSGPDHPHTAQQPQPLQLRV